MRFEQRSDALVDQRQQWLATVGIEHRTGRALPRSPLPQRQSTHSEALLCPLNAVGPQFQRVSHIELYLVPSPGTGDRSVGLLLERGQERAAHAACLGGRGNICCSFRMTVTRS